MGIRTKWILGALDVEHRVEQPCVCCCVNAYAPMRKQIAGVTKVEKKGCLRRDQGNGSRRARSLGIVDSTVSGNICLLTYFICGHCYLHKIHMDAYAYYIQDILDILR